MRGLLLMGVLFAASAAIAAKVQRGRSSDDGESGLSHEAAESGEPALGNTKPAPAGAQEAEEIEARERS